MSLNYANSHSRGGNSSQYLLLASAAKSNQRVGSGKGQSPISGELKAVAEAVADGIKMGNEQLQGLISREIRDQLFANIFGHSH